MSQEDTAVRAVCYTDRGGRPCGQPAVALLAIVPIGLSPDSMMDVTDGRIGLCMAHLVALMYSNGVGAQELGDVITSLSYHLARTIAYEDAQQPPRRNPTRGTARPVRTDEACA